MAVPHEAAAVAAFLLLALYYFLWRRSAAGLFASVLPGAAARALSAAAFWLGGYCAAARAPADLGILLAGAAALAAAGWLRASFHAAEGRDDD